MAAKSSYSENNTKQNPSSLSTLRSQPKAPGLRLPLRVLTQTTTEEPRNFLHNWSPCRKECAFSEAEELEGKGKQDLGLQRLKEHVPWQQQRDSVLPTTGNASGKASAALLCAQHISSSSEDHLLAESR